MTGNEFWNIAYQLPSYVIRQTWAVHIVVDPLRIFDNCIPGKALDGLQNYVHATSNVKIAVVRKKTHK